MGYAGAILLGYLLFGDSGCDNCVIVQQADNTNVTINAGDERPAVEVIPFKK